jgi:hypothetical protein
MRLAMTPKRFIGLFIAIASIAAALPAAAQTPAPNTVIYALAPESEFAWGCFEPCMCPILVRQPVLGTFLLTKVDSDPLFDYYTVSDVRWRLPDSTTPVTITGSGRYRRGGEVALEEQLTLDLSVDGRDPQHFDSGLVPPHAPFPEILMKISLHGIYCFDTVITVVAKPQATASTQVTSSAHPLIAIPSPFEGSTEVEFMLPRAGIVDLGVYDVTGRELRSLAHREWFAAGQHQRTWDGLLGDGVVAPPGLYFIRLGGVGGLHTRAVVKLR